MVESTANPMMSAMRRRPERLALIGAVAGRIRGQWHEFRIWLRYRPERRYMRGRSTL